MKKSTLTFVLILTNLLFLPAFVFGQSGRTMPPPQPLPAAQQTDWTKLEKFKLVLADGFDNFIGELNNNGKSGYRLEKILNYGGEGEEQSFAAILRLDGQIYEYDWISSPNKNFIESRLNYKARAGFTLADAIALTVCGESREENDRDESTVAADILRLTKGDVFLFEKKAAATIRSKEYKVFVGKIGLGKNPTQVLQTALDGAPAGFRPVKILFNKSGLADFAVSILLEKDLDDKNPSKIEYKLVKEVNGFEKEVNALAAQGFRLVSGRRIGLVKLALMIRESNTATRYTFIDKEKYAKEFDKAIAQGNVFDTVTAGDLTCDAADTTNEKLVFMQSDAAKKDYKILKINGQATDDVKTLLDENYQIKDLFFYKGVNLIFEK
jgi:hypothetical protein